MELNLVNEAAAFERLSVGQLRQRFAELFGETTHANGFLFFRNTLNPNKETA